jgi:O-antigen/teichoic acid export membrane protein
MKSKSVLQNTFWVTIEKAFLSISSLLLTPFVISILGLKVYGYWVILLSITNYFLLAQFGLSASFQKYIAEYRAKDDFPSIRRLVCTSFYTLLLIAIIIILLALVLYKVIFNIFQDITSIESLFSMFVWLISITCFNLIGQVFIAVPRGFQRFDISSILSIISRVIYIIIVVAALLKLRNIYSLVLAMLGSSFILIVLNIIASFKILPKVSFNLKFFDIKILRTMYTYGLKIQASYIASWIALNFDKLLIAYFLNPASVAIYDIGSKLVMFVRDIPMMLFTVLVPKTSELSARNELEKIKELYIQGTKYLTALSIGSIVLLYPIANEVLLVWLNNKVELSQISVYVFRVLLIGSMFNVISGVGSSVAKGIGKPENETYANITMALLNVILSYLFFLNFGIKGIVWGTTAAFIISAIIFFFLVNNVIKISQPYFFKEVLAKPVLINLVIISLLIVSLNFYKNYFHVRSATLLENIFIIIICIIIGSAFLLFSNKLFNYISINDLVKKSLGPLKSNFSGFFQDNI